MRDEYNFSKSIKNPYIKKLTKQVTIRLDKETVDYFEQLAAELDIPDQKLINLFLNDCAQNKIRPSVIWSTPSASS